MTAEQGERRWTPGPWVAEKRGNQFMVFIGETPGSRLVAAYTADGSEQAIEANAHLIAAAPDLYEALKQAVEFADAEAQSRGMPDGKQATRLVVESVSLTGGSHEKAIFDVTAARLALVKATGGAS